VALHKRYGISLSGDAEEVRRQFGSVGALAAMVTSHRTK